jgi:hypothetical protein
MSKVFWLGVIGLIFGILGAAAAIMIQSFSESFGATGGANLYQNAAGAIIFSIVGMVGAAIEQRRILGALFMIIGAIGVLISISLFGLLTFLLFLIGGILILAQKREKPVSAPPITGRNVG